MFPGGLAKLQLTNKKSEPNGRRIRGLEFCELQSSDLDLEKAKVTYVEKTKRKEVLTTASLHYSKGRSNPSSISEADFLQSKRSPKILRNLQSEGEGKSFVA